MRSIWRLLRANRDLRLLLGAGLVSLSGDWVLGVGVAYYVYAITGSTLASAGMLLASFLPAIVLGSVAGVFVDRWNRKTTMVGANLLVVVGLSPLLLVHDADQVWIVYLVAAWEGTVAAFFRPAEQALLPHLVTQTDLPTANALNGQIRDVSRLIGSAIGGVTVAAGGVTALALVDAATFLVSALAIACIRARGDVEAPTARPLGLSRLRALSQDWVAGLRFSVSQPTLRVVLIFALVTTCGEGIMGTLFVPFVRDVLDGGGHAYGLIVSVQAIGGLAGGVVAASLGTRISPVRMFGAGAILFGLIDLVMFLYPLVLQEIWPAVVCMVLVGVPGAVTVVGFTTLLQLNTTDAYRGRVFGALGVVEGVAAVAGTLSAGFLGESVGVVPILSLQGVGYVLAGAFVLLALDWRASGSADPASSTTLAPLVAEEGTGAGPGRGEG